MTAEPAEVEARRLGQLRMLTEVSRALTAALSSAEIYRVVLRQATELLGATRAVLLLDDEVDGHYLLRAVHGVEPTVAAELGVDASTSTVERLQRLLGAEQQEEVLAVPLVARDRVSGVLAVRLARTLADTDAWALAALADQAAVALDRAGHATPRQQGELLGLLVDTLEDHVIVALDPTGGVETWNHGAERALGHTAAEALGRPYAAFFADPGGAALAAEGLRLAAERGRHELEARWVRRDGREFWASVLLIAFTEPDGRPRGFGLLARDITARRAAERARQHVVAEQAARAEAEAQRDRYRLVGRATKDAIRDWDLRTGRIEWNEALQLAYGHPQGPATADPNWWLAHIAPPDRDRVEGSLRAALAGAAESWSDEYAFLRADGSTARVYDRGYILRDDAGQPLRMVGSMVDLTERVALERTLRDREERLRLAADAADVLTWRIDLDESDADDPPAPAAADDPTLADFLLRIHPDDRPAVAARLAASVRAGGTYDSLHRVVRPDGAVRWSRDRGKVVCDAAGRPQYITGAAADITDLEEARAESERARERAEAANRMKDEFLATASHELRTPLTAILGWARLLRGPDIDPERARKGMEVIERNARAQARLVEDILDVSRIISGKLRLVPTRVDLAALVGAAVDALRAAAVDKGVRLEVLPIAPDAGVRGDGERLQQVLWNLLSNAVKFTPPGGRVVVRAGCTPAGAEIVVEDTGQGIAPEFLPHVFERFRQQDGSSTRSHGGLGLGLAIVRHLVELHEGTVEARSPGEGQGATFTVRLPPADAPKPPVEAAAPAPPDPPGPAIAGLRVLVVDDMEDVRELLATVLAAAGAEVWTAAASAEALALLERATPDVLVSDIAMPNEDGHALIQRLRRSADPRLRHLPALALSAYSREEDRRRASAAGFQMHLPKPIQPAELVRALSALARRGAPA